MSMWFGCNQSHFSAVDGGLAGAMTFLRTFKPLAATWPVMPNNLPSLWSPRPDPAELLAGKLDAEIKSALDSAPPHSMLSTWHEANHTTQPAATMQKVHAYMHNLVHSHTSNIRYGVILTQGAGAQWAISGLDFYAIDLYDVHGTVNPQVTLNHFDARMPKGPRLVAETNSSFVIHRPAWFRGVFDWLHYHNGLAMCTFWLDTGPLSGPWVDDKATIYSLNRILADANRLA